jgi:polyhydroxyalkanoate synthesis regulator phasin
MEQNFDIIIVKKGEIKMEAKDKVIQEVYKGVLEEILEMLESDLQTLKTDEAKQYVSNVIQEIKDSL